MSKTPKRTVRRKTSDAVKILDSMIGRDARLRRMADQAVEDAVVGQLIHDARTKAGLTQAQLARLIGSDQSVISRLEDANYEGHSLAMLRRIASALGKRLEIRLVDGKAA
jgi:ribosome-binding protein aMBF1 (putative translation factor)